MGVSAGGPGDGRSEEIRTITEFRVVAVPSDAVILSYWLGVYWETTVALLAMVRAVRLEDATDTSLRRCP